MKKFFSFVTAAVLSVTLVACGQGEEPAEEQQAGEGQVEQEVVELVVGATNIPHAIVLEEAQAILLGQGIDLKVERFQDYVMPNRALDEGAIEANYFQHEPWLNAQIEEYGYDFVNVGGVHIEPLGLYSQKHENVDSLPDGAVIIMSDAIAEHGRILAMLAQNGLIELADGVGISGTFDDITSNPKNLQFEARIEPGFLAQAYLQGEGDAVVINSNYALDADLNPLEDSIAMESPENNPFANVIAVRAGDETRPEIQTLLEVLRSEAIQNFIIEEWGGSVVPVSE